MTIGYRVKLMVERPAVYASPIGAIAIVEDIRDETIKVRWIFAQRNECDGWYSKRDFAAAW